MFSVEPNDEVPIAKAFVIITLPDTEADPVTNNEPEISRAAFGLVLFIPTLLPVILITSAAL